MGSGGGSGELARDEETPLPGIVEEYGGVRVVVTMIDFVKSGGYQRRCYER